MSQLIAPSCISGCTLCATTFDSLCASELLNPVPLQRLTTANIGWYGNKTVSDQADVNGWCLDERFGVYILWHKADYCPTHGMFRMDALYTGKGHVRYRLRQHWKNKDFADQLLVYWTFVEMTNRTSKYIEQLLLDTFLFPCNIHENSGKTSLNAYWSQSQVDFG
jgi:hypothetical protein